MATSNFQMWSSVISAASSASEVPSTRHKHAVCVNYPNMYILAGKHGNTTLKDFWVYDLETRTWREIREDLNRPPSLQQHTMVADGDQVLVFGGELCMSNETPLWIYNTKKLEWRKWSWRQRAGGGPAAPAPRGGPGGRGKGSTGPTGRRGHTAILHGREMIIFGGYQDLRGSTHEMWSFNLDSETWRQVPCVGEGPPARHAHSALLHEEQMWLYGGMTDLQERNDLWRYCIRSRLWVQVRSRPNPGYLHSHSAVILQSSMVIFGGERQGQLLNELWRYHFGTCTWERLMSSGIKPHPRSQFCACVAPSQMTKGPRCSSGFGSASLYSSSSGSSGYSSGCSSLSNRNNDSYKSKRTHPSHLDMQHEGDAHSPVICNCPDCTEGSSDDEEIDPHRLRSLIQKNCTNAPTANLKMSISKFSQLNLSHLGRYYSYSVLSNDSTESIVEESLASTIESSVASRIVKSQSAHTMDDKNGQSDKADNDPTHTGAMGMTRDNFSVPNFAEVIKNETQGPQSQISAITTHPGVEDLNIEDDPVDLTSAIKGHLAFQDDMLLHSADTSISENLMSFSCTDSSSRAKTLLDNFFCLMSSSANVSAVATPGGPSHLGISSFANPNYVGYDPEGQQATEKVALRSQGGLVLCQDYWRSHGALDLESIRHREFAELLRTPPDSGIGLGVEMEHRTPLDIPPIDGFISPTFAWIMQEPLPLPGNLRLSPSPIASYFPSTSKSIVSRIPEKLLEGRTYSQNRPSTSQIPGKKKIPEMTLEDFVTLQEKTARFTKSATQEAITSEIPDHTDLDSSSSYQSHSGANRVTFSSQPPEPGSQQRNPREISGVLVNRNKRDTSTGGCTNYGVDTEGQPSPNLSSREPRANPFLKGDAAGNLGPLAMYIIGGKETGQSAVFKRPISIWKLDITF